MPVLEAGELRLGKLSHLPRLTRPGYVRSGMKTEAV